MIMCIIIIALVIGLFWAAGNPDSSKYRGQKIRYRSGKVVSAWWDAKQNRRALFIVFSLILIGLIINMASVK